MCIVVTWQIHTPSLSLSVFSCGLALTSLYPSLTSSSSSPLHPFLLISCLLFLVLCHLLLLPSSLARSHLSQASEQHNSSQTEVTRHHHPHSPHPPSSSIFMDCEMRFYLKLGQWSLEMMRAIKGDCLQLQTDGEAGEKSLVSFVLAASISSSIQRALPTPSSDQLHQHRPHRWTESTIIVSICFTPGPVTHAHSVLVASTLQHSTKLYIF